MGSVTQQIHIDAPAADVWAVLEDVRLLTRFSDSTVEVSAPPRLTESGQRFDQTVELAGRRFTSTWTVTDLEPGRRLVLHGSVLPGTSYTMTETLLPVGPCASTLSLTMDYKLPFGPLGRLVGHLGAEQRAVDEAMAVLEGVKAHTEARHDSEWTATLPPRDGEPDPAVAPQRPAGGTAAPPSHATDRGADGRTRSYAGGRRFAGS